MALANLVTLTAKQGDRARWKITWTDDDDTPIDVTGWSWEFSLAKDRRKSPAWSFTGAPQVVTSSVDVDPAFGELEIGLLPADSRAFGKLEEVEFEVTGHAPGESDERISTLDGTMLVRLEVREHEAAP